MSYSLMLSASVAATLYVLCAALNACFASSLSVTIAAPRAIPPPTTSSLRLLLLFLNAGRDAVESSRPAVLANEWRCDCRHVRHVHGAGRGIDAVRRASQEPCATFDGLPRMAVERIEADIIRAWCMVSRMDHQVAGTHDRTDETRMRAALDGDVVVRFSSTPAAIADRDLCQMPTACGVCALHMCSQIACERWWMIHHSFELPELHRCVAPSSISCTDAWSNLLSNYVMPLQSN